VRLFASIICFIASFCTLVIELVAGRLLAPSVGVSLYTWTSIIGVVLAGIGVGAWAGGWVADRWPARATLAWLLFAAGVAAMLIVPVASVVAEAELADSLMLRVVLLSFLLFFIPAFVLGMIPPVAVKLAVRDLDTTGRVVGGIYAFSTLGSIAGTYVTGFWLIAEFGTRATLIGVGVVLLISAAAVAIGTRHWWAAPTAALITAGLYSCFTPADLAPPDAVQFLGPEDTGTIHREESAYYTIRVERTVRDDTGAPLHVLHLDHLVHSFADPADPMHLHYGYLEIMRSLIDGITTPSLKILFIGGGGYTLPRRVSHVHPSAMMDVVEIDPAVTRTARKYFALPSSPSIRTINADARWFVMNTRSRYDVIIIDAFNDLSVPYHLVTEEFSQALRGLLAPGGVIAANLIEDFRGGRFLASYTRTLQSVFDHAVIVMEDADDMALEQSTFVVVASDEPHSIDQRWHVVDGGALDRYLSRRRAIVLTDDYVPVDAMLAPVFAARE
jgi:spermidine synthase